MKIAIYPGTFDPITKGHIDVIERASHLFDILHIVIAVNSKKTTLFSQEDRKEMIEKSLKHLDNIEVHTHNGLIIDYAKKHNVIAMIRGIRAISDFDYEIQLGQINRNLSPDIYTVFMAPHKDYAFLNSTMVRELAEYGADISSYVTDIVINKFNNIKK